MFGRTNKIEVIDLEPVIAKLQEELAAYDPNSEEFSIAMDHLEKLYILRTGTGKKGVDANTLAIVAGNLLGILIIVAYERMHVVTSKGLNFILKSNN